nr:protein kinase [Frankia sp. QA3]
MGSVYLSYTPGGRPVALKIARAEFAADPEFRRRFEREVTIAQQVQGPYTAPVIDCDPHAVRPWLATAYVAAPSLAAAVARQGPLPAETTLVLIAGVAEALQSIHLAGVIHRDLKPANVILAADGPRVIDFGISRAVEASSAALTQTGARIGTPAFMAPEHVQGRALDSPGDIFSLGSTAYYAVTGEYPFGGDAAVFYRIVNEQPDWDRCPEQVRELLARCVQKDPSTRPTPMALIELCREASTDERLRIGEGWLPPTVRADLTRYLLPRSEQFPPALSAAASQPPTPPPPTWNQSARGPGPVPRHLLPWLVSAVSVAVLAAVVIALLVRSGDSPSDQKNLSAADGFAATSETGTPRSSPASKSSAKPPSNPTPAAPTSSQDVNLYLANFTGLGAVGTVKSEPITMNGQDMAHSISIQPLWYEFTNDKELGKIEYDLGRHYRQLRTTIGLSDDSDSDAVYEVQIDGDGRQLADTTVRLGSPVPIDLDMSGILRLRFVITHTAGDTSDDVRIHAHSRVVLGAAQVTGPHGQTPS